jgi:hypothetical protein
MCTPGPLAERGASQAVLRCLLERVRDLQDAPLTEVTVSLGSSGFLPCRADLCDYFDL